MLQVKNKGPAYNFFGIPQPFDIFITQIALDYVSHFTESRAAAARLLTKFSLTVLKTNMASILQGGGTGDLDSRIAHFANKRHNDGILAIDREEEAGKLCSIAFHSALESRPAASPPEQSA